MSMTRTARALAASCLGLALSFGASGCATGQKSASKAKSAKVASKKASHFKKSGDADFSLGDVDDKLLKRGQQSMSASAFDSF